MKILITGKNGQLGQSINKIIEFAHQEYEFVFTGRQELDFSNNNNIDKYFDNNSFDVIVNCAAYTQVDIAEEEFDQANQVNHLGVKQLAIIAQEKQIKLIHFSTDYVFDGATKKPYLEIAATNPINTYGKTKLAGERAIKKIMPANAMIIRVSWLYSEYCNNFVKQMLRIGKERDDVRVISNQTGTPTYATDVARILLHIISSSQFNINFSSEIYHYSSKGLCSWYDFAKSIFEYKQINCKVIPIMDKDWAVKAQRPNYSVLDNHKIQRQFKVIAPFWVNSLHACLDIIDN